MTGPAIETVEQGSIRGSLHRAVNHHRGSLVLAHGAGSNRDAPILQAFAKSFCQAGFSVLRCDLPFRQKRPSGPPLPAWAKEDQAALREAVSFMRKEFPGQAILGGHSYGGRQATMLAAEEPTVADALLLLSYPLHPPRRRDQMRTAHWPRLKTPAFFIHGTRDPFGSVEAMREAITLIPGETELLVRESAGHDLASGRFAIEQEVLPSLEAFVARTIK